MGNTLDSTPAADGYRMPGEFEPHSGCWMAWPERPDNWRLGAKPAQKAYAAVAEAINASEPVTVAVSDAQFEHCRSLLSPAIRGVEIATDDAWIRDVGPTFVIDDNESYGKGLADVFAGAFPADGGTVIGREHLTPFAIDFKPLLTKIRAAGPDAIFFGGIGRLLSIFLIGPPPLPFIGFTILEIVGAPLFIAWQTRVTKPAD